MHLKQTSEAFLLAGTGIQQSLSASRGSGVNTEEEQLTDIRVSRNLECKSRKRLIVAAMDFDLFIHVVRIVADGFPDVDRGRQIVCHGVEKGLNAFVFES